MKQVYKTWIVSFSFLAVMLAFSSFTKVSGDEVLGVYWSPKKDAKIEIYKKGNLYFGKIAWAQVPKKDVNNPEPSLRNRDVVGLTFLTNLRFDEDEYVDGKAYDPDSGNTYSCKMWLEGKNLRLKGYLGISLIGRSELLERIP
ncbi:MAG: DUF2147 domain-containing protein [Cytophagaceae bacterium]|jgi:uncharacterized protein (DUF2147 family)|nr:DUF2147 domain-containing protein [Cytophagaceae bacterium]